MNIHVMSFCHSVHLKVWGQTMKKKFCLFTHWYNSVAVLCTFHGQHLVLLWMVLLHFWNLENILLVYALWMICTYFCFNWLKLLIKVSLVGKSSWWKYCCLSSSCIYMEGQDFENLQRYSRKNRYHIPKYQTEVQRITTI